MRKIWNDLQKPITWGELERSETPMWSSKPSTTGTSLEERYDQIIRKFEYADYLDKTRILGNILVDITFSDWLFVSSYMRVMNPRHNGIITNIGEPDGY